MKKTTVATLGSKRLKRMSARRWLYDRIYRDWWPLYRLAELMQQEFGMSEVQARRNVDVYLYKMKRDGVPIEREKRKDGLVYARVRREQRNVDTDHHQSRAVSSRR